ncbi:SAM-dependent methyltransferase [Nocardia sp. NPDC052278]|uniref:SAM-dependent methyltransferase n=1 Tax=unclassified Nocardia TaxID=2637762 RepID=UPI003690F2E4
MTPDSYTGREIDSKTPSAARMYHLYLTGEAVFDADRVFGDQVFELFPLAHTWAQHNRAFLARSVQFMANQGIQQFLDVGSGLPTGGNTHEIARQIAANARVVYVDNDLEAVTRAYELLDRANALDITAIIDADLRDPIRIFEHPDTQRLINLGDPVGLLLVSVLPFISDSSRPLEVLARLREYLPSGSYIAMTHVSVDEASPEIREQLGAAAALYDNTSDPATLRSRTQFTEFFDGFNLVDPGITYAPDWRPDVPVNTKDPARPCNFAAIGYKP